MADKARDDSRLCRLRCKSNYHDGLERRAHESVCRMRLAQCNCGGIIG